MKKSIRAVSRRHFLLAGGAATAAAMVAGKATQDSVSRREKPAKQGYSASEHINNYYRTAKV